jgi:NADH-quinone oxidoreductase subunit A
VLFATLALSEISLPPIGYGPVVLMVLIAIGMAAAIMLISHAPAKFKRSGPVKDGIYEAGMEPIGDARRRFHVRFYLVAVMFLLFDVELIFLYPWALVFFREARADAASPDWAAAIIGSAAIAPFLLVVMAVFVAFLVIGYIYDWRKQVFTWE